jgi:dimethylglycine dehydrogenase
MIGFALSGPKSRDLLARATHQDVSNAALPFMGAATLDVGLVRAKVARLSVTGELGYEINCRALEQAGLRRTLLDAGQDLGVREYGYNALLSLRLEKSFGIWSAEFTQDRTPRMTGMDRWIAWDKGDFLGRKAALAESKGPPPERQLVTLEIDARDADATGYEPVWRSGAIVGFITSGGYGHTVRKSLAMALIAPEAAEIGSELSVHIVGAERKARVIKPSPYDPLGKAMRA